ncbi:MAG TPA: dTMP kinase [Phycisphaerales bacterium]|nr:dTMP kinase [Phycisphaerales bacterium]
MTSDGSPGESIGPLRLYRNCARIARVTNRDLSDAWLDGLAGRFIVFDGPDGSGKSTQFRRLLSRVGRRGVTVCEVRDPGGTPVGERIRGILLDPAHGEMSTRCEMLLYMASRAQLVEERIRPALARGELVLADRFISSTLAYQGAAGGLTEGEILAVGDAACGARGAAGSCWPDLVVIFDVDERAASARLSPLLDRMERKGAEFHRKVREGYLAQARANPRSFVVVDATSEADEVERRVLQALRAWLERG